MEYNLLAICSSKNLLESLQNDLSTHSESFTVHGFLEIDNIINQCQKINPDLILLDQNLSQNVIIELIGAVKLNPQFKSIPIIISIDSYTNNLQSYFDAGADDYFELPIEPKALFNRLLLSVKRRKTLNKLEIQSEQFRDISLAASQAGNSLLIIDSNGEIMWVNEGFEHLYECNLKEFRERFGCNLFHGHINPQTAEAMRKCRENGEYVVYESAWITKNQERKYIQTSLTPIYEKSGKFSKIIAIETDITSHKMAEIALSEKHSNLLTAMEHLEEANKLMEEQRIEIEKQKASLEEEKNKTDALLLNILPEVAAHQLKKKGFVRPKNYSEVSVLFADFVNFSSVSVSYETIEDFITALSFYFEAFDEITTRRFIEKIKTIGDCYMCVGGVPQANKSHAFDTVLAGLEIQKFVEDIAIKDQKKGKPIWRLRIGIHSGGVMAGVIGKKKFAYDIWGDTVNVASRIETKGEAGKVNISETTYQHVKDYFKCTYRGKVPAKNIGEINMYFVERILPEFSDDDEGFIPNANFRKELAKY
jgi:PAS domain S-box-containing protein